MPLLLSILACSAAGLAILAAWRGWRASRRLALEMVHLRDRLAAAESHYEEAAAARAERDRPTVGHDASLAPRVSVLESRLHAALDRRADVARVPEDDDVRARIRRHLQREGYTVVAFLQDEGDDLVIEAERGGIMSKGRVEVGADGSVRLRSVSTLRAFP